MMSDCLIAINTPYNNRITHELSNLTFKKSNDEDKESKFIYIKQIQIYISFIQKYKKIDPIRDVT